MLTLIAYIVVAAFVGLVVLGHILVLQALFTSGDHADGKREQRPARGFLPDVPV